MDTFEFDRTTFVIGAGAHVRYGYPTAKDLTSEIKNIGRVKCNYADLGLGYVAVSPKNDPDSVFKSKKNVICNIIEKCSLQDLTNKSTSGGYVKQTVLDMVNEFCKRFGASGSYSIDSWLASFLRECQDEYSKKYIPKIAKIVIAYLIYYNEQQVFYGYRESNWIQYITNTYLSDKDVTKKFYKNPPNIITFNYDFHLEWSLFGHLTEKHHFTDEEAKGMIKSLGIRHVYGDINSFDYNSLENVCAASVTRLSVMGEDRSNLDTNSEEFGELINKSDYVYFLGFGFDKQNTELLMRYVRDDLKGDIKAYSTNFGLNYNVLGRAGALSKLRITLAGQGTDCQKLLESDYPPFEKNIGSEIVRK